LKISGGAIVRLPHLVAGLVARSSFNAMVFAVNREAHIGRLMQNFKILYSSSVWNFCGEYEVTAEL